MTLTVSCGRPFPPSSPPRAKHPSRNPSPHTACPCTPTRSTCLLAPTHILQAPVVVTPERDLPASRAECNLVIWRVQSLAAVSPATQVKRPRQVSTSRDGYHPTGAVGIRPLGMQSDKQSMQSHTRRLPTSTAPGPQIRSPRPPGFATSIRHQLAHEVCTQRAVSLAVRGYGAVMVAWVRRTRRCADAQMRRRAGHGSHADGRREHDALVLSRRRRLGVRLDCPRHPPYPHPWSLMERRSTSRRARRHV